MKLKTLLQCFRDDATVGLFRGKADFQYITAKRIPQWFKNNMPFLDENIEVELEDNIVWYKTNIFGELVKAKLFKLIRQ